MKYSFYNDYAEGAHPDVLAALCEHNLDQEPGYGLDRFSLQAVDIIRAAVGNAQADVHFVSAGTLVNFMMLAAMMRPHEAVIAVETGHINVHEAGAVEATGHKVIPVPHVNGKLVPEEIDRICGVYTDEHMVKPRVAYISNTTELGTVYSKAEIEALSQTCKRRGLYFYVDGARLGSALTAAEGGLTLSDLSRLTDAFYIGGTKNGGLLGEALVINTPELQKDFRYHLKQRGALLAKGRAIALQFSALFSNDLYMSLARHANQMATLLAEGFRSVGYSFLTPPVSNQIFPTLSNGIIAELEKEYGFYIWEKGEERSSIRLVTSWATTQQAVDGFVARLKELSQ